MDIFSCSKPGWMELCCPGVPSSSRYSRCDSYSSRSLISHPGQVKSSEKKKKRESSLKVYFNDQTLKHVSNGGGNANTAPLTGRWCLLTQSCGVSMGTVRGGNVHREQTHTDDGSGASLISGLSSNHAKAEGKQVSITWEVEAQHAAP